MRGHFLPNLFLRTLSILLKVIFRLRRHHHHTGSIDTMASETASASQWHSPASRPEHVEQLISGVDRYNPQNLDVLHDYLAQQLDDGSYDLLANLAILKL